VGDYIRFADVVQQVANSEPEGFEKLYRIFGTQVVALRRQFGYQSFEDRLHDVFLIVVEAIQSGKVREPKALLNYIQGTSRFVLCSHTTTKSRRQRLSGTLHHWESSRFCRHTPEESLWLKERSAIMRDLLRTLSLRERELLERFYIYEQDKTQICREMGLTDTQFRLAKSRAKAHLARLGAERLIAPAQSRGLAA
jgi:RNA polymerase sigma-70 factor (ECF subfamily)